jgi:uncharacterized membrane-anchored protein
VCDEHLRRKLIVYMLSDSASWGLILGVVLSLLTAVVQQPNWSPGVRRLVAVAAAVAGGVLTALASGQVGSGQTIIQTVAAVLVAAQASYDLIWKPTGAARAIESATSRPRAS